MDKMNNQVNIVVLAAGKGTRLNAIQKPKVMYLVKGRPMIDHLARMLLKCQSARKIIIVIGFRGQQVIDYLNQKGLSLSKDRPSGRIDPFRSFRFVWQRRQLGTGHAVVKALEKLTTPADQRYPTIVLNGDHPFFSRQTIRKLLQTFLKKDRPPVVIITTVYITPDSRFGRIIKDSRGLVQKIVEYKNCTASQKKIREGNVGAYLFDTQWLRTNLKKITKDQVSGEYYLTDLVDIAVSQGERVVTAQVFHPREAIGINTSQDLNQAEKAS